MIPWPSLKPYLYGALALAVLAFAWWFADRIERAALYDQAQEELGVANDNIAMLAKEREELQERHDAEAKKRHEIAIRAASLERKYAGLAGAGDAAAFNEQLCQLLEGIQGAGFGEEAGAAGSACDAAAGGEPRYTLTAHAAANLLTNLSRLRDYVQQVEEIRDD